MKTKELWDIEFRTTNETVIAEDDSISDNPIEFNNILS